MLYLQLIFELPFNANQVQPEPVYEASGDESSGDNINTDDEDLSKPESQMLNTIPNQDSWILVSLRKIMGSDFSPKKVFEEVQYQIWTRNTYSKNLKADQNFNLAND